MYVPPNSSQSYLDDVLTYINSLPKTRDIIILGDFNSPDVDWCSLTGTTSFTQDFCDLLFENNFSQLVTSPTHMLGNLLDLVLTNVPNRIVNISTDYDFSISDHYPITFHLETNQCTYRREQDQTRSLYNYHKTDQTQLFHELQVFNYVFITNAQELWSYLKATLINARNMSTPICKVSKEQSPRWHTSEIRHLLKKINTLRKSLKKSKTQCKEAKLLLLESTFQAKCADAKIKHERSIVTSFSSKPKTLFRHLKRLRTSRAIPKILTHENVMFSDTLSKANALNNFFHSTFSVSNFFLPPIEEMPTPSHQLHDIVFDPLEVYEELLSLDTSKAMGCDNLHPALLKMSALQIYEPVSMLFDLCLSSGLLPEEWKIHKIVSIPKKGDLTLIKNYRPISLLCMFSKILERIVYKHIIDFIRPQLSKNQFGFLKGRSCLSQLLTSYSEIVEALNAGESCDVINLDFAKAFDKVSHNQLLFKLWRLGITGNTWKWFECYLSNRTHYVCLEGTNSSSLSVLSGVPQGSILGPLLFLIYVNDITTPIVNSSIYIYADDTKLVKRIANAKDQADLQSDLDHLVIWCKDWNLSLNLDKCVYLHFGKTIPDTQYNLDSKLILTRDSHKDLGVTIQNSLSWDKHINDLCSKAYSCLYLIKRNTQCSHDLHTKRTLYTTLVRSNLTFCSQVWRPQSHKAITKVEQIQRRSSKFILNLTWGSNSLDYKSRLIKLDLLPLMNWLELQDVIFAVRCLQKPADNFDITEFISFSTSNTRLSSNHKLVHKGHHRSNTTRHFYFKRLVRLWNALPFIDLSHSISTIKNQLYKHFWNSFLERFDQSSICTYHIVCPCCSV